MVPELCRGAQAAPSPAWLFIGTECSSSGFGPKFPALASVRRQEGGLECEPGAKRSPASAGTTGSLRILLLLSLLSLPSGASLRAVPLFCGNTGARNKAFIPSEGSWDRAGCPAYGTRVSRCPAPASPKPGAQGSGQSCQKSAFGTKVTYTVFPLGTSAQVESGFSLNRCCGDGGQPGTRLALCGRAGRCWRWLGRGCENLTLSPLLHAGAVCLRYPSSPAQIQPATHLTAQPSPPAAQGQLAHHGEPQEGVCTWQGPHQHMAGTPGQLARGWEPAGPVAWPFVSELGEGRSCCSGSSPSHGTTSNGG